MSKYKIKPLNEDFENPFNRPENKGSKKPIKLRDKGGLLKPRREIFNINRVVYTKRPNGEYTILSKTQFGEGEIIEICPIIFVGVEAKGIPRLKDFVFEIEKDKGGMYGVVLGYGSLYKHSDKPNVSYAYNRANRQMYFMAARVIQAQEELTINYGKDYWDERATFNMVAPQNETPADSTPDVDENVGQSQAPSNSAIVGLTGEKGNPSRSGIAAMGGGQS